LQAQTQGMARIANVIGQQIMYNTCSDSHHATKSVNTRHNTDQETFCPLYMGLKLYGDGKQKQQINNANAFGIFVSYSRLMEVKRFTTRSVVKQFVSDGDVLPTNTLSEVFVTFDVELQELDNLDSHSQGNFSQDEFHGTAISVTNHLSWDNLEVKRPCVKLDPTGAYVLQLPECYSVVQPTELPSNDLHVPSNPDLSFRPSHNLVPGAKIKDESWMAHVAGVLQQDTLLDGEVIIWSGYSARLMCAKQDWNTGFLKNIDNKKELFLFLSTELVKQDLGGRLLLSTNLQSVLSNKQQDISGLQPYNHTEADTGILLHLAHAANQGHQIALVRTVYSDVVILAIHWFASLGFSELWMCLGTGNKIRDVLIYTLSAQLGPSRCMALSLFHAVMGCDTVSHILRCGKKTAWSAWQSTTGLTDTLMALSSDPQQLSLQSQHMQTLERFVVVMYSKDCGLSRVNETRLWLFTSGKKTLKALPPTQAALYQHIRRAVLQAIIWNQATSVHMDIPDFKD